MKKKLFEFIEKFLTQKYIPFNIYLFEVSQPKWVNSGYIQNEVNSI